ncbi:TlpA family protein disulfide reductase [Echinicola jeungdonensis]|uniref:TlpA family protein disulfide reductase n=1 Tax=Echinicola jeungdonensis TaxID=709343 RepID=UPI00338E30D6
MEKGIKKLGYNVGHSWNFVFHRMDYPHCRNNPIGDFVHRLFNPDTDKNEKANHGFIYQGQLKDRNGKLIDLKDYKGKTLFINLWATWCAPCRAEMPHIASLYEKVKDQENLEFLMLALDDDFNKSEKYVDAEGFGFPVFQAIGRISPSLHSQSIPTTLVVNKEGKIVFLQGRHE